ncbi:MAG: bifunctional diaminohydroxyphosphoribosylaminopyrimidine deaminase/5-amino-6-(5-phosphoribosylamino)uracil reductase RibD [Crocinitomicaceae bacterium]|jgi:diaminohydroxyphosphoribosylaminopyrimidine deaminase/5-amino-6-(5-phosphoribosylamino)uracil reductase
MNQSEKDNIYMQRCLYLASLAGVNVSPNPMVGAVIVYEDEIIGEGYHQFFGGPHAEVNAVNDVHYDLASKLNEATIYVSLEPCAHTGKTPPCLDLILKHKFKRVVIGCKDPNPLVSGKSIELLIAAGIEVNIGILEKECLKLNKRFFTYQLKKRPYVILKWAQTKDGYIDKNRDEETTIDRKINWISHPDTQSIVHHWRSKEQAILVGWKTIEHDNPSLTVREVKGLNPLRIIIDSNLNMPKDSKVFTDGDKTIIINKIKTEESGNVSFVKLAQITTRTILTFLYELEISSVFVEGGSGTLQHFLLDGLWDEARVIQSKVSFGDGIKAPKINGIPSKTYSFAKDQIFHYFK